ncbi:MAG: response regulator [Candidatus Eisenbacteria bacterium]|uniref:Response regulator n=1 Tax=Eiseniibacteriota bacterium TaxID=2212470 RepID=A0A538T8D5_UNCEI|nr:MAG: response regulator [Candidatus Eisenbacteria bacterium]
MSQRIMIVEDDPMNAKLFQLVLTRKGHYVIEITEDPARVIEEIKAARVDLVIMDVSLSNSRLDGKPVDGLQITRRLKGDPATRHVPVLLATAHAMKGSKEKSLTTRPTAGNCCAWCSARGTTPSWRRRAASRRSRSWRPSGWIFSCWI